MPNNAIEGANSLRRDPMSAHCHLGLSLARYAMHAISVCHKGGAVYNTHSTDLN